MLQVLAQAEIVDQIDSAVDTTNVTAWDVVWAVVTVVVGAIMARITRRIVRKYGETIGLPANLVDLLGTMVLWSIITIAVVFALTFVGLDVTPLWLIILFVAILLVLGGRGLLEAFGAGILLQARGPFGPGDTIVAGGEQGVVQQVNSRTVVIDTPDGRRVLIPNTEVIQGTIINMSEHGLRMSSVPLDVTYGTDLDFAARVAVESVADLPEVLDEPAPIAQVGSFEASAVRIQLRFWHEPGVTDEWAAVDAASRAAYAAYYENGIEFAFPQLTLWRADASSGPDDDETDGE